MATASALNALLTRSDEDVQRDVLAEFKWDARVKPSEIGVAVRNGVVTLTGGVDSYTKKWSAEEAAFRVGDVTAVANDIEVRPTGLSERTDPDIAEAVKRALEWDSILPDNAVQITVSKGWVTLKGQVEWEWQYQKVDAERVVRRQKGVKGVTNLLVVKPREAPSDL